MVHINRIVQPGRLERTVLSESGELLTPPEDWGFLPAGDAALTKSVKAMGETWLVQVRKGKRLISKGIWANEANILLSQKKIKGKRSTPEYSKRRERDFARREAKQKAYAKEFCAEVVSFLDFHSRYQNEAKLVAKKVAAHATPIGSGTVARTELIPVQKRAEAAVIAWMRHQTTSYESMSIAHVKGKRREVRKQLAAESINVLQVYRQGENVAQNCPLKKALV